MSLAQDAIVVRGADGTLHSTPFLVSFKVPGSSGVVKWIQQLRGTNGTAAGSASANSSGSENAAVGGAATNFTRTLLSTIGVAPRPPPTPTPLRQQEQQEESIEGSGSGSQAGPGAAVADVGAAAAGGGVRVYVNEVLAPALEMVLDGKGRGSFVATGTAQPAPSALAGLPLRDGRNALRFEYGGKQGPEAAAEAIEASLWLWAAGETLVVSDVDGTISRSDVKGYIHTVHLGRYEHTHAGVCRLYSHLATAHDGVRFLYLTSRPLSLLPATRAYIAGAEQDDAGHKLPPGPILCSPFGMARVLYKELIEKTIRAFKQQALVDVAEVFHRAGRPRDRPVFALGFGNKTADALAYRGAGVPADAIFVINARSEVRVHAHMEEEQEEDEEEEEEGEGEGASSKAKAAMGRGRLQELRRTWMGAMPAWALASASASPSPPPSPPPSAAAETEGEEETNEAQQEARPVAAVERITMSRGHGDSIDIDGGEAAAAELMFEGDGAGSSALLPSSSSASGFPVFSSYGDERLREHVESVLARDRAPCHEPLPPAPPAAPVGDENNSNSSSG